MSVFCTAASEPNALDGQLYDGRDASSRSTAVLTVPLTPRTKTTWPSRFAFADAVSAACALARAALRTCECDV